MKCPTIAGGLEGIIVHALTRASLYHLPQGSSYQQKSVNRHEQYVGIHKCRKTDESECKPSRGLTMIVSPRPGESNQKL
jgi:hypothetical protein